MQAPRAWIAAVLLGIEDESQMVCLRGVDAASYIRSEGEVMIVIARAFYK